MHRFRFFILISAYVVNADSVHVEQSHDYSIQQYWYWRHSGVHAQGIVTAIEVSKRVDSIEYATTIGVLEVCAGADIERGAPVVVGHGHKHHGHSQQQRQHSVAHTQPSFGYKLVHGSMFSPTAMRHYK